MCTAEQHPLLFCNSGIARVAVQAQQGGSSILTFWASGKLLPTSFLFQTQLTLLKRVSVHTYSMKFYRAHLHHFLSALPFITKLLIYLKWKKKNLTEKQNKDL